jgi:hypothetical protein
MMVVSHGLLVQALYTLMAAKPEMCARVEAAAVQAPLHILVGRVVLGWYRPTLAVVGALLGIRVMVVMVALEGLQALLVVVALVVAVVAVVVATIKLVVDLTTTLAAAMVVAKFIQVRAQTVVVVLHLMVAITAVIRWSPFIMVAVVMVGVTMLIQIQLAVITTYIGNRVIPVVMGLFVLFGRDKITLVAHTLQLIQGMRNEIIYTN